MTDAYLEEFVREAEEAITELNNSLLELESDPENREAMDAIFRTAHTLKGNFGAMGFEDASDLAHAIEDLLDAIREGEMAVTPEVMDLVFAGVDRIEAVVGEIEEHGEARTDSGDLVEEIRSLIEAPPESAAEGPEAPDEPDDPEGVPPSLLDPVPDVDGPLVHARVEMGDSEMPGVDGLLVVENATESLDLLGTEPDPEAIEDGEYGDGFDLLVAADPGAVEEEIAGMGPVSGVAVTEVTDRLDPDDPESGADRDGEDPEADEPSQDGAGSDADEDEIKSIRVEMDQLDDLYGLVEQLVTTRIKLRRAVEEGDREDALDELDELDKISSHLQNTVMDMRLIPMRKVVGKFPRLVRDLAREQEKEIDFEMTGQDVELDRTILTEISDPLMHVLRNAVDHGIEPPGEREAAGKPREGHIELRARRERDTVVIEVEDDGAGLDVGEIREKAIEEGVHTAEELDAMGDSEIYDLVFHPGFSTSEEVTDVSGRGVGMDVVHSTVSRLDGSVNVESDPGEGTTVTLRLPVSMAIVTVLFLEVGDREYGVPIKNIDEISRTNGVRTVNGERVIEHDDEIYPIVDLAETFDLDAETNGDGMLVRIREEDRKVAIECDDVTRQEEVVVKPLEGVLSGTPGLSGTAVLGDGNVVHILDVVSL